MHVCKYNGKYSVGTITRAAGRLPQGWWSSISNNQQKNVTPFRAQQYGDINYK